jgi:lysylphosphatidylglycerol synthetase-like protein (DUF2156 family)
MLKFLKDFFSADETIIGLYRFKSKFIPKQCRNYVSKYEFKKLENPFFEFQKTGAIFNTNLIDNKLLI